MSNNRSSAIHTFKRLSTLELNGGKPALSRNWQEPVDLKVKGGMQVFKTLNILGNIDIDGGITVTGNLTCNKMFVGNITETLSAVNIQGNLCGNVTVIGNTVVGNLKSTGPLTSTGPFEHYGWLGSCVHNSASDTSVCATDTNHIVFTVAGTEKLTLTEKGSVQHGGVSNNASGRFSHASGGYTKALGKFSHAEGYNTTASGLASHAENNECVASGDYSHAEGEATLASGFASHAQGQNTIASGRIADAEGVGSNVSGNVSHGEGVYTTVSSNHSYVEGVTNLSSSFLGVDHIEGRNNLSTDVLLPVPTSSAGLNHVQGESNVANGWGGHIEGGENLAQNEYVHVGGYQAVADQYCQWSRSAGKISTVGDAQTNMFHLRTEIMGATTVPLDMVYPTLPKVYPSVPLNNCWMFELQVIGRDSFTTDYYAEKFEGMALNTAGTLSIQTNSIHKFEIGTLIGTSVTFSSAVNGGLVINVTSASTDITHWAGTLIVTQVK